MAHARPRSIALTSLGQLLLASLTMTGLIASTVASAQPTGSASRPSIARSARSSAGTRPITHRHISIAAIVTGQAESATAASSRSTTNYGTLPGTGGQFGGAMIAGPLNVTPTASAPTRQPPRRR